MAYLEIFNDGKDQKIGEMRIIDNQNIIFDIKGNKVGYCVVCDDSEKYYDTDGNIVETVEDLVLHK